MAKSSTSSRTEKFSEKFHARGIKDANACLYWMQQLVEVSTKASTITRLTY
jgi:hypothetical protein